jgi:putative Holliday junction resolvase
MRKLGIDYGDKRIGFALSDITNFIASPLEVLHRKNIEYDLNYIKGLAEKHEVNGVIIGLPLNMDGATGERANIAFEFGDGVKMVTGLPVYYVDERLTTLESEEMLIAAGVRWEKRKEIVDKIAAARILQSYLDNPRKYMK